MPHRIAELERIAGELALLGTNAVAIGELQLARAITDAIVVAQDAKMRIAGELAVLHKPGADNVP
jgi:tetrahydromethanopterin S-methyltransferase subunit C